MFRGSSFHNIDPKGRIIIPSRFRNEIKASESDDLMITRMDGCLVGYVKEEWSRIETKILSLAEKSDYIRRFRRVFVGGAHSCHCDKQGRVLIPPMLRDYSKLEKEVVLVGVLDHFELWSRDKWEEENALVEDDMKKEDVRNAIAKLGL